MRLLFLGDVFASSGRKAIQKHLPRLRKSYRLDVVIANGENATHGAGLLSQHGDELLDAGIDVITNGNHVWDQKDIIKKLDSDERFLRPANYADFIPGRGIGEYQINGKYIKVINLLGQIGMRPSNDPFVLAQNNMPAEGAPKKHGYDAIVIDMHAEATSEKAAMAYMLDGRASLVIGTHTHVPTCDERILPNGTAFQSDCGMCGDYQSVIGLNPEDSVHRFYDIITYGRSRPAEGEGTLSGLLLETDPKSGLAAKIAYIRKGGTVLTEIIPKF